MTLFYFNAEHAIREHDFIIENSGGSHGMLNRNLLESVLEHIKNDNYYPTIEEKLCHLFFSITKNHAFNDGNKRSAIVLSAYFLELNGFDFRINTFIRHMENIVVYVADNSINKKFLFEIISSILYEENFPEELQVKMVSTLNKNQPFESDDGNY